MTRILVVGSAGYVGRRVMAALAQQDVAAIGADLRTGPGLADLQLDLRFPAQSYATVLEAKPDVVLNLAYVLHAASNANPQAAVETNTVGVNGLFEACARLGVGTVVYISSGSVYGDQSIYGDAWVTEETPLPWPRTLYQLFKQFNERMAEHYNQHTSTRFVGLRLSSPHSRAKQSEVFNPLTRIGAAIADGRPSVRLPWSRAYEFCFNHVDDSAAACVRVAQASDHRWRIYNAGGETMTLERLGAIVRELYGLEVTFEEPGGTLPHMSRISSKRLEEEFGYRRRPAAEWIAEEFRDLPQPV